LAGTRICRELDLLTAGQHLVAINPVLRTADIAVADRAVDRIAVATTCEPAHTLAVAIDGVPPAQHDRGSVANPASRRGNRRVAWTSSAGVPGMVCRAALYSDLSALHSGQGSVSREHAKALDERKAGMLPYAALAAGILTVTWPMSSSGHKESLHGGTGAGREPGLRAKWKLGVRSRGPEELTKMPMTYLSIIIYPRT
jgi:hypothetical protein